MTEPGLDSKPNRYSKPGGRRTSLSFYIRDLKSLKKIADRRDALSNAAYPHQAGLLH